MSRTTGKITGQITKIAAITVFASGALVVTGTPAMAAPLVPTSTSVATWGGGRCHYDNCGYGYSHRSYRFNGYYDFSCGCYSPYDYRGYGGY